MTLLKVLTAISFLLIVDPFIVSAPGYDPPTFIEYLTSVQVAIGLKQALFLKGQPFGLEGVLLIAYSLSVIYLLFFPYSRKRGIIILELFALSVLCILALLITMIAASGFLKFIPSLVTIVIFWGLAIVLFGMLWKNLITIKQQHHDNINAI